MPPFIDFKNTYTTLPENFYRRTQPVPVKSPELVTFNFSLAEELGFRLQGINSTDLAAVFSGNVLPLGAEPLALAYAGHQFGHFVPQLGDGRAILLGEIIDEKSRRRDIQLKGSGSTAYSRQGDGRAALGPMLREYLVSEAMHGLGIPTTRALALVLTGEQVQRENLMPGAVLTRIAQSHIRIGTFEYFAFRQDLRSLKILADYTIWRHYPDLKNSQETYFLLFNAIRDHQAFLVAQWMRVGFVHGVMNTDNMAVSGETIDYGPCAFLDEYQQNKVFSSIDRHGRYAFARQPAVALWNLYQLARTLILLEHPQSKELSKKWEESIEDFEKVYQKHYLENMGKKIGLPRLNPEDVKLLEKLLTIMQEEKADYTLTFHYLTQHVENIPWLFPELFKPSKALQEWIIAWQKRQEIYNLLPETSASLMRSVNPAIIPRNHIIEAIIQSAITDNDFSEFKNLIKVLTNPYIPIDNAIKKYARAPGVDEKVYKTFCGT
jgi:uncharacterized protein YdiU (UPF0061 family)